MRGTYEAYILVKIKDGRQFVCALNRKRSDPEDNQRFPQKEKVFLMTEVIWN